MAKKKKSIWNSWFYRIYFALIALSVVGIIWGMNVLKDILADYESAQPSYVADMAVQLFADRDYDTIYSLDTTAASIGDGNKEFYVENMREITDGKTFSYSEAYSASEDERIYNVLMDGAKFGKMTLVPSGYVTARGNTIWALSSFTTNVVVDDAQSEETAVEPEVAYACSITVPTGSTITVDGEAVSDDLITQSDIAITAASFLPSDVPCPTMTQYAFTAHSESPEIVVTDSEGRTLNPVAQEDAEHTWFCDLYDDPEIKEMAENSVIYIAETLAKSTCRDSNTRTILKLCAKDSPAYKTLSNFDNDWGALSKGAKFENVVTANYHMYSDTCFSCTVSFDYVMKYSSKGSKSDSSLYTLYFIAQDGTGKLYNFSFS